MSFIAIVSFLSALFLIELLYFKIANHFNIIDAPNHRSSHTRITLRGGGIIFPIAVLLWFFAYDFAYPYFFFGLISIAFISFLDDVVTLNNKIRLFVHLFSVALMFMQWDLFSLNWYWLFIAMVFVIGTINAYNFMDGINGISGSYSLITALTLLYINDNVVTFTSKELLILIILSLIVFNIFNFRKKAKCFAGDVGSVSIAFILIFLIGQLILKTENFNFILLLLLYGLDTVTTISFRKIRKENIFEAHRSHFYQYLANQKGFSHLTVSVVYFLSQMLINLILLFLIQNSLFYGLLFFSCISLLFLLLRFKMEGKVILIGKS